MSRFANSFVHSDINRVFIHSPVLSCHPKANRLFDHHHRIICYQPASSNHRTIKNDSMRLFSTESMKPIRASEISKGVGASPRPKPKSVLNASFFLNQRFLIFLLKINKLVFAPFFLSIEKPDFEFNYQRLV